MARVLEGHNIWALHHEPPSELAPNGIVWSEGPHLVLTVKQFLPAGVTKPGFPAREKSIVDLTCDDGRRVFAVADIWSRNPQQASDPW